MELSKKMIITSKSNNNSTKREKWNWSMSLIGSILASTTALNSFGRMLANVWHPWFKKQKELANKKMGKLLGNVLFSSIGNGLTFAEKSSFPNCQKKKNTIT